MFSEATESCVSDPQNCMLHFPRDMFQFMSVMLVDTTVSNGSMPLFGYIAVRDERDWMLNYIFNRSRDDPIIVQQVQFFTCLEPLILLVCFVLTIIRPNSIICLQEMKLMLD
jgi:hypothetical protein